MHALKPFIEAQCQELCGYTLTTAVLEVPPDPTLGDFANKAAFALAKQRRMAPPKIAAELAEQLRAAAPEWLADVSATGPYINLRLSDAWLMEQLQAETWAGTEPAPDSVAWLLEYVSANPTGPLHIGHARWAAVGDSLARLLTYAGERVQREFYVNDAGMQVANLRRSVDAVRAGKPVPEDGYHGDYVKELAQQTADPVGLMLAEQRETLHGAGVEFDVWFSELDLHRSGAVEKGLERLRQGAFTFEHEGALWFRSTAYGDDKDRVLRKSDGSLTYFAADIAYHLNKLERGFGRLVNLWGADHHGYIKRVDAAVAALSQSLGRPYAPGETLHVLLGQLVNLFRNGEPVRMSKRTGDMVSMQEVMDEIGVDALRYLLIRKHPNTHMDFDLAKAVEQSPDNPVYYVQYAYARLSSILRKASVGAIHELPLQLPQPLHPSERAVILKALQWRDVVAESAALLEPQRICTFLEELAVLLHVFYHDCRVIDEADAPRTAFRLALVQKWQGLFRTGLELLGVSAPEQM